MTDLLESKLDYFFSILDANGNSILQPNDFVEVANKLSDKLRYGPSSPIRLKLQRQASRLFVQILTDMEKEDDQITPEDWFHFFEYFHFERPGYIRSYVTRIVNYIFLLFDRNFDKYINREEYSEMFRAYGIDYKYEGSSFDKLDKNKDGFISQEELIQGFCDFFFSSDPNAPGNWIFGNWKEKPFRERLD
ncbi:MAG: hypothetical protein RIM99_08815 [Cyclobacteriaceae bacterium]